MRRRPFLLVAAACLLLPSVAAAQGLTGALIGTVKDAQGGVLSGADVRISSPALIGGPQTLTTDAKGELRFPALPPGLYVLDVEMQGFAPLRVADIFIGAGATIERTPVLKMAGFAASVVVEGAGSRIDARDPGFGTRFGAEDLDAIPMRRFSSYDWVKTAPGISPTSPAGGNILVSALGSGVDQNQFLFDGTNVTAHRQRRRASRSGHRLHSGTADPIRGRVGRVRQCPGRRRERHHQIWKQPLSIGRVVLLAGRGADQPAPATSVQGSGDRLRARDVP